jgi:sulfur carrier protein ThiS
MLQSPAMHITVRLGDPLWRKAGQRRLELELADGQSVADALALVAARPAPAGAETGLPFLGETGHADLPLNLFVNRRKVPFEQAGQAVLHDGDEIALFLIVVGG